MDNREIKMVKIVLANAIPFRFKMFNNIAPKVDGTPNSSLLKMLPNISQMVLGLLIQYLSLHLP